MALFRHLTEQEVRAQFTHEGWFYLCPIWCNNPEAEIPQVAERNWVPAWWFWANVYMHHATNWLGSRLFPNWRTSEFVMVLHELED